MSQPLYRNPLFDMKSALRTLSQSLTSSEDLAEIWAALEKVQRILPKPEDPYAKKTITATSLSSGAAADMLGIKYKQDKIEFFFNLKEGINVNVQPSEWCATAIENFRDSQYHHNSLGEPQSRTVIDLLIHDRLRVLDDKNANKLLRVSTEVDIRVELVQNMKREYKAGYVTGRADYMLSHGRLKSGLENALVIIEAKKAGSCSNAITQTLCYLGGIQNARKRANKVNIEVFGIMSDGGTYQFALLDKERTAFISQPISWPIQRNYVVAYIDHILRSAIEASPHDTPVKIDNKHIMWYSLYLEETFDTGVRLEEQEGNDEAEVEGYDVVEQD